MKYFIKYFRAKNSRNFTSLSLRPSCDAVVSCIDVSVNQHERCTVTYISFIYINIYTHRTATEFITHGSHARSSHSPLNWFPYTLPVVDVSSNLISTRMTWACVMLQLLNIASSSSRLSSGTLLFVAYDATCYRCNIINGTSASCAERVSD